MIPGQAAPADNAPKDQPRMESKGPGQNVTETTRLCQAFDNTPAGTVVDGYRKESVPVPMGPPKCFWTAVGK